MNAKKQSNKDHDEMCDALREIAAYCFDLTISIMATDVWTAGAEMQLRAHAAHRKLLQYRRKYMLRSRAEVETGKLDVTIEHLA